MEVSGCALEVCNSALDFGQKSFKARFQKVNPALRKSKARFQVFFSNFQKLFSQMCSWCFVMCYCVLGFKDESMCWHEKTKIA